MAVKKFTWVGYSPPLDCNPRLFEMPEMLYSNSVLDFSIPAPSNENGRLTLHTKFYPVSDSPSDEFQPYKVRQDRYRRYTAYDPADPSSDSEVELTWIYPDRFTVYELKSRPGSFYAAATANDMKEVFRRYRASTRNKHAVFKVRVLNIQCLEKSLIDAEVVGYTLLNVSGITPYRRLQAEGPQMAQNPEARDFVQRAGHVRDISFRLQRGMLILELQIRDDGSIKFQNYPGDSIALDVIGKLEPFIEGCSDTESVQVRKSGGR